MGGEALLGIARRFVAGDACGRLGTAKSGSLRQYEGCGMNSLRLLSAALVCCVAAGVVIPDAFADPVTIYFQDPDNTDTDVVVSAQFNYTAASSAVASMTVLLRNDSDNSPPGDTGVTVTAFAFNAPDDCEGYLSLDGFLLTSASFG